MIRGKDNVMEWVKSTPGIKQVQVRTAPGADAFLFQSDEGENKKTIEDRLSRTLDYLEPGKYYIEMSDGNSRRNITYFKAVRYLHIYNFGICKDH